MSDERETISGDEEKAVDTLERVDSADLPKFDNVAVGQIVGFTEQGIPLIGFEGQIFDDPTEARTTVPLGIGQIGADVTLAFEGGDRQRPIVMGVIRDASSAQSSDVESSTLDGGEVLSVDSDGERVVLEGRREVVLRCGKSSLVLREDGKVVVRGTHIVSRSTGPNRIKGASVSLN